MSVSKSVSVAPDYRNKCQQCFKTKGRFMLDCQCILCQPCLGRRNRGAEQCNICHRPTKHRLIDLSDQSAANKVSFLFTHFESEVGRAMKAYKYQLEIQAKYRCFLEAQLKKYRKAVEEIISMNPQFKSYFDAKLSKKTLKTQHKSSSQNMSNLPRNSRPSLQNGSQNHPNQPRNARPSIHQTNAQNHNQDQSNLHSHHISDNRPQQARNSRPNPYNQAPQSKHNQRNPKPNTHEHAQYPQDISKASREVPQRRSSSNQYGFKSNRSMTESQVQDQMGMLPVNKDFKQRNHSDGNNYPTANYNYSGLGTANYSGGGTIYSGGGGASYSGRGIHYQSPKINSSTAHRSNKRPNGKNFYEDDNNSPGKYYW